MIRPLTCFLKTIWRPSVYSIFELPAIDHPACCRVFDLATLSDVENPLVATSSFNSHHIDPRSSWPRKILHRISGHGLKPPVAGKNILKMLMRTAIGATSCREYGVECNVCHDRGPVWGRPRFVIRVSLRKDFLKRSIFN